MNAAVARSKHNSHMLMNKIVCGKPTSVHATTNHDYDCDYGGGGDDNDDY